MKRIKGIFLLILPVMMATGCCTKKECEGADEIREVQLINFSTADVDTVICMRFQKNTGFTSPVDSIFTAASERGGVHILHLQSNLDITYDYVINLPGPGSEYKLSQFKTDKEGCGNCFPYRPQSDYYNRLSSYEVNAVRQSAEQINLYK